MGNFKRAENWKFNGFEDTLDTREIIDRYNELAELETRTDDHLQEMTALEKLIREGEGLDDWDYGKSLVRDSYFKTHAQKLAEEVGAMPKEYTWPTSCIDWDQAAYELRMDYTPVEFNGSTYWAR